ncbi:uncharacterized protein LOC124142307 isoform X1 [Haliotis rufescens]|uniref:uncharacterized protein LOC124142307 isoform X1 n=1 Tax=Haliotis rufescens TaxID=6454 RepID=UPI00201E9F6F|nr:uncharacterized protein LOC124142307 isoform X1 [Haliotis rufescens]
MSLCCFRQEPWVTVGELPWSVELREEFKAIRWWLHLIREVCMEQNRLMFQTNDLRIVSRRIWKVHNAVNEGGAEVSRQFLCCDPNDPNVHQALVNVQNSVIAVANRYKLPRILPPPIFVNGVMVRPTFPSEPGRFQKFIGDVRSRFTFVTSKPKDPVACQREDPPSPNSKVTPGEDKTSPFRRFLRRVRNIGREGSTSAR